MLGMKMHEELQAEMERQENRLDERIFQPPVVKYLSDIKRLLLELEPKSSSGHDVVISSSMIAEDANGRNVTYKLSAVTSDQSKRAMIVDGMKAVRARLELSNRVKSDVKPVVINGREMTPIVRPIAPAHCWVDDLLQRWFGATRDGLRICWDVEEGRFLYDIFEHKLFRAKPKEGPKPQA